MGLKKAIKSFFFFGGGGEGGVVSYRNTCEMGQLSSVDLTPFSKFVTTWKGITLMRTTFT